MNEEDDGPLTADELDEMADVVRLMQTWLHPFYAPFVAMTVRGLRARARLERRRLDPPTM